MLSRIAHAKINLALHVTGKREDGYHLLDTLVVFTQDGDKVSLCENQEASQGFSLTISGPFARGLPCDDSNLVLQAATLLAKAAQAKGFQIRPVEIQLEKNLPVASGMGGGSADAAATLLALKEYWQVGEAIDLFPLASKLGADVAMCLHSKPLRAEGIGEIITPLILPSSLYLVLINPLVEVSTPQVFKALNAPNNPPIEDLRVNRFPDLSQLKLLRNDLQYAAQSLEPEISKALNLIDATHSQMTRMSGSGATCFGLYSDMHEAEQAAESIRQAKPHWWSIATSTLIT